MVTPALVLRKLHPREETTNMSLWQNFHSPLDSEDENPAADQRDFPKLFFGVELEFSLAALPLTRKDHEPTDGRQVFILDDGNIATKEDETHSMNSIAGLRNALAGRNDHADSAKRHIVKTLTKAGFRAIVEPDMKNEPEGMPLDRWIVTEDWTIKPPPQDLGMFKYTFVPVEVQSPPYLMSEGSLREVQRCCHLITRTYRTCSPESSGLHVHVGNRTQGFPLQTVQNLMAILFAFEPALDMLYPEHRRYNSWCVPLRRNSVLAQRIEYSKIELRDSMDVIYRTTSINQLIKLMGACDKSGWKMTINLQHLKESETDEDVFSFVRKDEVKRTIEFRQHEGTLDPEAVYHYVKTCVNFVEFAQEVSTPKLREWLRRTIDMKVEDFPAVAVLHAMKIPHSALYYERKIAEREDALKRNQGDT
jgi:hypothetical protein